MKYFALIHGLMVRLTEDEFKQEEAEQLLLWGRAYIILEDENTPCPCKIILQSKKVMVKEMKAKKVEI